jgi:uncharacterized Ntn-hydrolase superfamily protein
MLRTRDSLYGTTRLASTFSIVALDPKTMNLGVAVQSRYFSVGTAVPWAKSGVGAVATQSFVNISYGPRGLNLLRRGFKVHEVIQKLTSKDKNREYRQLGIIDAKGNAVVYTGAKCLEWAGSRTGKNYTAQGNILASEKVVTNMGKKFETTRGDLADRLVAALEGGEEEGGDARGRQSAALLVVGKRKSKAGYGDRLIDLRVEDHSDPIAELKRLLKLHHVYSLIDEADEALTARNPKKAIVIIEKAIELNPHNDDTYVQLGMVYKKMGKKQEAETAFKKATRINLRMKTLIDQLAKRS